MKSMNKKFNKIVKKFKNAEFDQKDFSYEWSNDGAMGVVIEEGEFSDQGLQVLVPVCEETFIVFDIQATRQDRRYDFVDMPSEHEKLDEDIEIDITDVWYAGEVIELTRNQVRALENLIKEQITVS